MSAVRKAKLIQTLTGLAWDAPRPVLIQLLKDLADGAEYGDERDKALVTLNDAGVEHRPDEQRPAVAHRDKRLANQRRGMATRKAIEAQLAAATAPATKLSDEGMRDVPPQEERSW